MRKVVLALSVLLLFCPASFGVAADENFMPPAELNLKLAAPVKTWDEALPLGNGMLGGLLWGEGNTIRLSLDRGDLWDLRTADRIHEPDYTWKEIQKAVAAKDQRELIRRFDNFYNELKHPTKLPGGRLEIVLDSALQVESFELDLATATGLARFANGATLRGFYSADRPVALFRIPGARPPELKLLAPVAVKQLGYAEAARGADNGECWFVQEAAKGLKYAAVGATRRADDETLLALTIHATRDGSDPLPRARAIVRAALADGYDAPRKPHVEWWRGFWAKSWVRAPEANHLRHYYLVQYFYGAASRRGAPPMPLQGVWTADGGSLPPWKGDYHHDLNTQMTYVAYQAAGRFDEGACFLDFMYDLLPQFRQFAKKFYDAPGAAVPSVMTQDGQAMGGWIMYSLSPTNGAWVGFLYYQHWLYTRDEADLERGYAWCSEIGDCLLALLEPDANGVLKLPLSSSPEIYNNSLRAWLTPNSNYDHDCMLALFRGLEHMARELDQSREVAKWRGAAEALGQRHVDPETNRLMFAPGEKMDQSHRHLAQSMAIHPFGLLNVEGSDRDRAVIRATNERYDELGTRAWTGYSFSWMACLRARAGEPEAALRYLDIYEKAFILRNGFHVNGDQLKAGLSGYTYRPFTLEGNFLAAQAMHEMLLQSWNGVVRVFPATPWRWHAASFGDLHAEGGFKVSARRENNATTWLKLEATRDASLRLRDNFGGRTPTWSRSGVKKEGSDFVLAMKAGDVLEATFDKPDTIPSKPANAAEPLVITRQFIRPNKLPLRIGADSQGSSRFVGDIARASLFNRPLSSAEISALAQNKNSANVGALDGCVASWDFQTRGPDGFAAVGAASLVMRAEGEIITVEAKGLKGKAVRLDGKSYLETKHHAALGCLEGLTLEAWVRPEKLPASGARIIDKTPVGGATAYLLDTYPGNSLRLIFRDPHVTCAAKLPVGEWTHVAATVDGDTGAAALFLNGEKVAEQ